jgi:Tfp pilus assembly protein PilF
MLFDEWAEANKTYPPLAVMYCDRGAIYLKTKQYDLALQDLNRSIELDPNKPVSYQFRAQVYEKLGQAKSAAEDAATASKLNV